MAYSELGDVNAEKSKDVQKDGMHAEMANYLRGRLSKMDNQIRQRVLEDSFGEIPISNVFEGLAIYIDGYTEPSSDVLRDMIVGGGGRTIHWFSKTSVTHVVATQLARTKIRQWGEDVKICKPEWITESVKAGKLLPWKTYELMPESGGYDELTRQRTGNNPTIQKAFAFATTTANATTPATTSSRTSPGAVKKAGDDGFISEFYGNSRLHHLSDWRVKLKTYVADRQRANSANSFPMLEKFVAGNLNDQSRRDVTSLPVDEDDEFDVFQEDVPMRSSSSSSSSSQQLPNSLIMHIDLDCFFVSAGLLSRPHLVGKPVVVTHSTGRRGQAASTGPGDSPTKAGKPSFSEIASCSYEARAMGVRNGMFLGQALKLCPDLVHIPYEFDKYDEISHLFYDTLLAYTNEIEPVSCDEAYVDLSSVLKRLKELSVSTTPSGIVAAIRRDIFDATGCNSSAGVGKNRLIARLCTRLAKPRGQYLLLDDDKEKFDAFIAKQEIADLPGVGHVMISKIHGNFGAHIVTCGDLQSISQEHLGSVFGPKTGQFLYESCRGICRDAGLKPPEIRKSVSAEINYGMRFSDVAEFKKFLTELVDEVVKRLNEAGLKGQKLHVKLRLRSQDAPKETKKFLGHGVSDAFTKSVRLESACNTAQPILTACTKLLFGLNGIGEFGKFDVADVRGLGVQLTKLVDATGAVAAAASKSSTLMKAFARQQQIIQTPGAVKRQRPPETAEKFSAPKTPKLSTTINQNKSPPKSLKRQAQVRNSMPRPSLIGVSTLPEVCALIDEWLDASPQPCADDLEMIVNYFLAVVDYGDLSHVYDLLRHMRVKLNGMSPRPDLWLSSFDQVILYSVKQKLKAVHGQGAEMPVI